MRSYACSNKQENMIKAKAHTNMVDTQYVNEVASVCSYIYGPNRNYNQIFTKNADMTICSSARNE